MFSCTVGLVACNPVCAALLLHGAKNQVSMAQAHMQLTVHLSLRITDKEDSFEMLRQEVCADPQQPRSTG